MSESKGKCSNVNAGINATGEAVGASENRRHMRLLTRIWRSKACGSACGLCLLVAASHLAAQNPTLKTRTKEQRDRAFLAAHRITINVQVDDSVGKPVPDLAAGDFTLFDNNQPRKIAGIHMIDGGVLNDATEVILLLDAVNSTAPELKEEREAIFNYLAKGRGPLPYPTSFALWFNGHLKGTAPTTDRNAVGRAFVNLTKNAHSNACSPVDASVEQAAEGGGPGAASQGGIGPRAVGVAECLQAHFKDSIAALDGIAQQQKTLGGRTILVWMGPGWPILSDVEFGHLTPKAQAGFFEELVDVLHDLREAQVTIDAVAPPDGTREKELARIDEKVLIAGTNSARDAGPASLALPVLAFQTGGRVLTASHDVNADLNSCIRDADGYYSVSFEAMPATSPHEFHKIEMKVSRPGLEVRTMTAYYAEP